MDKEIQEKLVFKEFCHNKDINLIYNDFLHLDSSKHSHKNGSPDFFNEKNSIVVELTEYHRDIHSNQSIRTLVSAEIEIILVFILKLLFQLNSNRSIVIAGFLVSKCETPEIIPARELEFICQSILKNARDHFRSLNPHRRLKVFIKLENVWQIHKKKERQNQLSESIARYIHSLPNDSNEIYPDPFNPLPYNLSDFISYMTTEPTMSDPDLEFICQSILDNARDHFRSLSPLRRRNVFIKLNNEWQIKEEEEEERKQLSESIAQYVHSLPNDSNKIDPDPSNPLPYNLSHFISCMTTEPTMSAPDDEMIWQVQMIWQVVEAEIADVVTDSVDSIIKGKDEKIDSYKKNLEQNCEIWLLIHSSRCPTVGIPDLGRFSTYGRITNELRARYFKTSFDRVYYFDKSEPKVIQLKIER